MYTGGYAREIEPTFGVSERELSPVPPLHGQTGSIPGLQSAAIPGHIRVAERDQFEREIASVPALGVPRKCDQAPLWISVQQRVKPGLESATSLVGHGLMSQVLWNMNRTRKNDVQTVGTRGRQH